MARRIAWALVAVFVATNIWLLSLAWYAENGAAVGIRERDRIEQSLAWYPLARLFRPT